MMGEGSKWQGGGAEGVPKEQQQKSGGPLGEGREAWAEAAQPAPAFPTPPQSFFTSSLPAPEGETMRRELICWLASPTTGLASGHQPFLQGLCPLDALVQGLRQESVVAAVGEGDC